MHGEKLRRLSKADQDALATRYLAREHVRSLALEFGVSPIVLSRYMRSQGIRRQKLTKLSEVERERLKDDYLSGMPLRELADVHQCAESTIVAYLVKNGIRRQKRVVDSLSDEQRQTISQSYAGGLSLQVIGAQVGIGYESVRRCLIKMGEYRQDNSRSGERHPFWKGGRLTRKDGYIKVKLSPDDPLYSYTDGSGYILEHRYVMAQHVGRPLASDETVHHVNGDKADNRLENLQVRTGRHGSGERYCCAECGSLNLKALPL